MSPIKERLLVAVLGILVFFGAAELSTSHAFTPKTRAEIVLRAMKLMPDSLERQLDKHGRVVLEGAVRPPTEADPSSLQSRLESAVDRLVNQVQSQTPMADVARTFGEIARASTDLSYALNVGPDDPRNEEVRVRFARYVEQMLPKMKLTFDGFSDAALRDGRVGAFADGVSQRAARDYDAIMRSYYPEGRQPTTQDFDERSVAFAAATLETSLAMTATAKAWLYAWSLASGDMAGAAYVGSGGPKDPFGSSIPPLPSTIPSSRE